MPEDRKIEIEKDLKNNPNDPRYEFTTPKTKSAVWENFEVVNFEGSVEDFARCKKCKSVIPYASRTGTSGLMRHKCKNVARSSEPNQQKLTNFVTRKIPINVKSKLIKAQMMFSTTDLRPLNVTEGAGFKALGQALIDVGANYGRQNIDNVLVSRRTLMRDVIPREYDEVKKSLEIKLSENDLSFTTDMWTDEYTQMSFLTLTTHYVDEEFELKTNVLGTREFKKDKKTGINILDFVLEILKDFKIDHKLKNSIVVTDNGANVVNAFKNYKRISCSCHNLNLVMSDVLEDCENDDLQKLIENSKHLVQYFKHSELNNKLTKSLKQHVKTRWNSLLIMFSSIFDMKKELEQILSEKNQLHKLYSIDFVLLEVLIEFLTPFKICSESLSADLVPTIHECTLWYEKLFKHCVPKPTDSALINIIKINVKNSLNSRFQPHDLQNIATFLNPPFKRLTFLSEQERSGVINSVKILSEDKEKNNLRKEFLNLDNGPSTSKKSRVDYFQDFADQDQGNVEENEIDLEIKLYQTKITKNVDDVLKFWKDATDLPKLRCLSRRILCIPASSASSERVFSTSGRILEERRTKLLGENLDKILFLNKNIKS